MENNINLSSEFQVRNSKLVEMSGICSVYADKFERTHELAQAALLSEGNNVSVCGRIVFKRTFGKFMFVKLQDINGILQVSFSVNEIEAEQYNFIRDYIDVADFIGVSGEIYRTKTGEITVKSHSFKFLSKALRPLPEKWHGMQNIDLRYRQRYLDLTSSEETRKLFVLRSKTISYIRRFLDTNGFLEIETPILQNVASGAAAKPFVTKHNALDMELYLRIAPELYLKQAVAGGFDRVYEIGKNFRNEGMDASHLQEFTMLEWYAAYWDYNDNIKFSQDLLKSLMNDIFGTYEFEIDSNTINFDGEWARINYTDEINKLINDNILLYSDPKLLRMKIEELNLLSKDELDKATSIPSLIDLLYKKQIRPNIIQPTILYNYPACLIPLARQNDDDSRIIDMFQLVVAGWEIVKAYSELVNPIIQKENFMQQAANKTLGDEESFEIDHSFMLAMEHGMPPMSGLGLGIDRLIALLCNQQTLRDVVLFPIMK